MTARRPSVAYVGRKFGRLTVVRVLEPDEHRHVRLECICDCGNSYRGLVGNISRGLTSSCGCLRRERATARLLSNEAMKAARIRTAEEAAINRQAFVGRVFARLTVVGFEVDGKKVRYRCQCACGRETITARANLERGHTKSCGCLQIYRHPERRVGLRKLLYRYRMSSKRRGFAFDITLDQLRTITSQPCYYCGGDPSCVMKSRSTHSEWIYNGLDRVDSTKGYEVANVVPCCATCNRMKLDHDLEFFVDHVQRIVRHLNRPVDTT